MHFWFKDEKIHTILPSEHEPEEMGDIYKMDFYDSETYELLRQNVMQAEMHLRSFSSNLIHKTLSKENN